MIIDRMTSTGSVRILDQSIGQGLVLVYTTRGSTPPSGFIAGRTYQIGGIATNASGEAAHCAYYNLGAARDFVRRR
jgi:hypothetical protein